MRKPYLCFLSSLLTLLLCVSCAKDSTDITGNITGTVYDRETNNPLAGVAMSLSPNGEKSTTGNDGTYTFRDVDAGVKYTVQASKSGYESDTRDINVTVGGDSKLDFHLKPITGKLKLSQQTLDFGNASTTLTFDIINDGHASLSWQISEDVSWMECLPASGQTPAGGTSSVVVTVDRTGLAKGTYSQTVAISSNGGSVVLKINMSVMGMMVECAPSELDFGAITTSLQLMLTNHGSQSVSYVLQPSNEWIIPSKNSGTFQKNEALSVSVNREGLAPHSYEGAINLIVGDDRVTIPVKMEVLSKELPSVTLIDVSGITMNSATFTGGVIMAGSSAITRHGFCWDTNDKPVIDNNKNICNLGDMQDTKDFVYTVKALKDDTRYYVRAYAVNAEGISYSKECVEFRTLEKPGKPSVSTGTVSSVTASQAVVEGNILKTGSENGVSEHGHVWSKIAGPTLNNDHTRLGAIKATGPFASSISGLSPHSTYYVRAYATNESGTVYGDEVSFTTEYDIVSLTTIAPHSITHNAATTGGSISSKGGHEIAECGVCWGMTTNPTINDSHIISPTVSDRFEFRASGFTELTEYNIRAYVKTATGDVYYGNVVKFKTTHEIKLASAGATTVSGITTGSASFRSSVTGDGNGNISDCGFVYSRMPSPTVEKSSKVSCGKVMSGTFSTKVSGLADNTTYYVRAYIINEAGTAYGEECNFATLEVSLPVVTEPTLSRITYHSAKVMAKVLSDGNGNISDCGFVYSTSPNPGMTNHKVSCGTQTDMTATVSSLISETDYYIRAYAVNEKGTVLGEVVKFTTEKEPKGTSIDKGNYNPDNNWDK